MQKKNKVLYIHIPRTAGSSINECLKNNYHPSNIAEKNLRFFGHEPFYLYEEYYKDLLKSFYKFSVVRNPYTRVYSLYLACLQDLNLPYHMSFYHFLTYIRSQGNSIFANITLNKIPFACFDQCFFLIDSHGQISLDKIYHYENLREFETDFFVNLSKINSIVTKYSIEDYLNDYTKQNISLVRSIFYRDFLYFGYSLNFEDSIKGVDFNPPL